MPNEQQHGTEVNRSRDHLSAAPASNLTAPYVPEGPVTDEGSTLPSAVAGRNLLFHEIGRGGMGAVFKGRDTELNRELAIKVLREEHRDRPDLVRRFLEEAQIAGQLQHPGVAPIYELGRFADNRPYFTMKLVKGHTLADLLRQRADARQDLGWFLGIFVQVCQTVAYAHSQGVIHRDLKPSNVMVGGFGEVQVMDWGLAQVLRTGSPERPEGVEAGSGTAIQPTHPGSTAEESRTGIVGTPAYMPPEQARGESADERADVFSLGAMLCELLTGHPAYTGPRDALWDKARGAAVDEAFARLDVCGADTELIALAKRCLAPERDERPHHAGEVAQAVAAYLTAVEERARQAEQERVAALARAEEAKATAAAERRAKRMTVGLAAATLLLLMAGGTVAWMVQERQAEAIARQRQADDKARDAMAQVRGKVRAGCAVNDVVKLTEADADAERAADIASGASAEVQHEAADLRQEVKETLDKARKNRDLIAALLDVSEPRETRSYQKGGGGMMMPLAEPTADERFAAAFRRWGVDIDQNPLEELVTKLQGLPELVRLEVVAGLDEWVLERRRKQRPEAEWRRPHDLAEQLDGDVLRREVRRHRVGGEVLESRERLQQLVGPMDPRREPVLGVALLARTLEAAGQSSRAERILRIALAARPYEVVLLDALGKCLERQKPPRLAEAIECYRAVRGLRPQMGIALATALGKAGRGVEGEEVLRDLAHRQPDNPEMHFHLGLALGEQKKLKESAAAFKTAIDLQPKDAKAHYNLGLALHEQKKLGEAVVAYKKTIHLQPDFAWAYNNLGNALAGQKQLEEAVAAFRKAIDLQPDLAQPYNNLGNALHLRKQPEEAVAAYKRAIDLQPDYAQAYYNLGIVLAEQKKLGEAVTAYKKAIHFHPNYPKAYYNLGMVLEDQKKLDEAVVAYKQAINLQPDYVDAYLNLGVVFRVQKQLAKAVAAFRKAIDLQPDYADAYHNLGNALQEQKKLDEAVVAYKKAIDLQPDLAEAFYNLGNVLAEQKKLEEALAAFRRADQLMPNQPPIRNNLRVVERMVELNRKLPDILAGKDKPRDVKEQLELAQFCCTPFKQSYRAAATFYRDAFAAEPQLANDLRLPHRYDAACAAALAAAGKGEDAAKADDKERARLRQQARDWLAADLALWTKQADNSKDSRVRELVQKTLEHWQTDPDLAALRERDALVKLPEREREVWGKLWEEVEALRKKAADEP